MPRPTDVKKYPDQFLRLAKRFERDPTKGIPIKSDNPKALQLELQAFRAAIRQSAKQDHYPHFLAAEIRIGHDKQSVIVVAKNRTASALEIQQALASLNGEHSNPDQER